MEIWKIIRKIVFGVLVTACILSFAKFLYFTELLDIQKVVLQTGTFDLIDKEKEFEFDDLRNKPFNVVIRCYREGGIDYSSYASLFSGIVPFTIDIELKDPQNGVIKKETYNQNHSIAAAHSIDYFQWTVMRFNAERGKKYKIKIIFNSDNKAYDRMKKEIYVEQDYDPPSAVWWLVFQRVYLIVFIVTVIPVLIISLIYWRRNKRASVLSSGMKNKNDK